MPAPAPSAFALRKPRLLKTWTDVARGDKIGARLSQQELLFHVCFAVLWGGLRAKLQADHDVLHYVQGFFATWSIFSAAADYATRFNDEDAFHTVFWGGYGVGLIALIMHSGGLENFPTFAICAALIYCWLSHACLRVAYYLPRCRGMALFWCGCLLLNSLIWLVISRRIEPRYSTALRWITATQGQWTTLSFVLFMPREYDLPMNIEYHIGKFTGISGLAMAQLVVAVSRDPPAQKDQRAYYYGCCLFGFFILFALHLLLKEANEVEPEDHAIHASRRAALGWMLLTWPMCCFSIISVSCGLGCILTGLADGKACAFGGRLLCLSVAGFLFSLLGSRSLHKPGPVPGEIGPRTAETRALDRALLASVIAQVAAAASPGLMSNPLKLMIALAVNCGLLLKLH